jgi:uncharacterized membrane protein
VSNKRVESSKERKERQAKERVEKAKRKRMIMIVSVVALVAVLASVAFLAMSTGGSGGYTSSTAVGANTGSSTISIPISDVGTTAQFSTYDSGGTAVRFFEVRDSAGNLKVATDACDVCYANHKGYRQTGTSLTCNNCGKVFQISNIGTENTAGGCWPSYLPMTVDGGNVTINKSDLDAKAFMFQ